MKKILKVLHRIPFYVIFSPILILIVVVSGLWWLLFGWQNIDDSDEWDSGIYW